MKPKDIESTYEQPKGIVYERAVFQKVVKDWIKFPLDWSLVEKQAAIKKMNEERR